MQSPKDLRGRLACSAGRNQGPAKAIEPWFVFVEGRIVDEGAEIEQKTRLHAPCEINQILACRAVFQHFFERYTNPGIRRIWFPMGVLDSSIHPLRIGFRDDARPGLAEEQEPVKLMNALLDL